MVALNRNFDDDWILWLEHRGAKALEVSEPAAFPEGTEALCERAFAGVGMVQRRDRGYLDWRYLRCPTHRYRVLAAREPGGWALRGLLVLRDRWGEKPVAPLVDWIVEGGDVPAHLALAHAAAGLARAAGSTGISRP